MPVRGTRPNSSWRRAAPAEKLRVWQVDVTPGARQSIDQLDEGLRLELIEQVSAVAEAPATLLHRPRSPDRPELWAYEYASGVLEGLRVRLLFHRLDFQRQRMTLVAVGRFMDPDDPTP